MSALLPILQFKSSWRRYGLVFFNLEAVFCKALGRHANNTLQSQSWWFQSTSSCRPWTRTENISKVHKEFVSWAGTAVALDIRVSRSHQSWGWWLAAHSARQTHEFAQPHARESARTAAGFQAVIPPTSIVEIRKPVVKNWMAGE